MSLVSYPVTVGEENFSDAQTSGKNYIAAAIITLTDLNLSTVVMYDDAAASNGSTAKTTGTNGTKDIFIEPGEYLLSINGGTARQITVASYQPIDVDTYVELLAVKTTQVGQRLICRERSSANYVIQESSYVMLDGDVTLTNGIKTALQVDGDAKLGWFATVQNAIDRASVIIGDINTVISTPALTMPSNRVMKKCNLLYNGAGSEDFITLDTDLVNTKLEGCLIDGNDLAEQAISGNGGIDCSIRFNKVKKTLANGIQVTKGTTNQRFNIHDNAISETVGHGLQLRGFFDSHVLRNAISTWGSGKNGIELQDASNNINISYNVFKSTGDLFGIESAGSTAEVVNSIISNNIFSGQFTGISGKFSNTAIGNNVFTGGQNTHRSGIEIIGSNVIIEGNKINGGSIAIASNGTLTPTLNADTVSVINNHIVNSGIGSSITVGAVSTSTGTPTSTNIDIKCNTINMSAATGSAIRALLIGDYGNQSQIDNINIQNNTIIGGEQASSEAIRLSALAGSGTVNIKLNTIKAWNKGIRINNDNLANVNIRFNDLSQDVATVLSDISTTTTVVNSDNDL